MSIQVPMPKFLLKIFHGTGSSTFGWEFLKIIVSLFFEESYCFRGLLVWSNLRKGRRWPAERLVATCLLRMATIHWVSIERGIYQVGYPYLHLQPPSFQRSFAFKDLKSPTHLSKTSIAVKSASPSEFKDYPFKKGCDLFIQCSQVHKSKWPLKYISKF